jgi:pimeloyl-ACP methyl ester carboxylesterase
MLSTRDVVVSGVRSAVYEAGAVDASEAVVFVHGNPGPLDDWEQIAPALADSCRVVAMDMPGFGRAERPRRFDFSVQGYARHLGGLLDQLGVRRAHLVLHDFGGPWGLAWAVEHPRSVASVTLISSVLLSAEYEWHTFAKVWQMPLLGELLQLVSGPFIAGVMRRNNPRPLPDAFVARVLRNADWAQKMAVMKLYRAARDVRQTFGALGERVRALDLPACVIWGADDRYAPVQHAEAQRELFPRAEVHVLPAVGHWPFIDEPDEVRALVCSFVRRQLATPVEHRRGP